MGSVVVVVAEVEGGLSDSMGGIGFDFAGDEGGLGGR